MIDTSNYYALNEVCWGGSNQICSATRSEKRVRVAHVTFRMHPMSTNEHLSFHFIRCFRLGGEISASFRLQAPFFDPSMTCNDSPHTMYSKINWFVIGMSSKCHQIVLFDVFESSPKKHFWRFARKLMLFAFQPISVGIGIEVHISNLLTSDLLYFRLLENVVYVRSQIIVWRLLSKIYMYRYNIVD